MNRQVRTSAKALVIRDGRMLALRMRDSDGEFFIMPGGGQQAGEVLPEAVAREVPEETGITVAVKDIAFVIEGSQGEVFHRVDIVFRCELLDSGRAVSHPDSQQIGYEWLPVAELNRTPLFPSRLRRPIMDLAGGKRTAVYLGNECMGDPEQTD